MMEGEQHNTYDVEFFGANSMVGTLYLGALKAAALMAEALGDDTAAARFREVYESGRRRCDATLWNGEYYEQQVRVVGVPPDALSNEDWHPSPIKPGEAQPRYQYGPGCLSDQVLGQWFSRVVGLGYVLPRDRVRQALRAVFQHNWRRRLDTHARCQRTYALNDEAGLLLCSWPRGGRPAYPFPYADEVWTGIEYQVAAHLIYEGMLHKGLSLVKAVRDRHDGARRNPWDEFECGHHYARAMASWSVLLALSGYRYSALDGRLGFAPALNKEDFRCFFSTGAAWGAFAQRRSTGGLAADISVSEGALTLNTLDLVGPRGLDVHALDVRLGPPGWPAGESAGPDERGEPVEAVATRSTGQSRQVTIALPSGTTLAAGQSLRVRFRGP
jgi:hypothetical protein